MECKASRCLTLLRLVLLSGLATTAQADAIYVAPAEPQRCVPPRVSTLPRPPAPGNVNVEVACTAHTPPPVQEIGPKPPANAEGDCTAVWLAAIAFDERVLTTREPTVARLEWVVIGLLTVAFALCAVGLSLSLDGGMGLTSHWGGFGSSGSGWELSASGASLLMAAIFAALAIWLGTGVLGASGPHAVSTLQAVGPGCSKTKAK